MAYTPTEWQSGDIVTSAKLNKIEQGIADASGGGGVLIATLRADIDMQSGSLTFGNCSKTGAELKTAVSNGVIPFINFTMYAENAPFANMILVIDSIDVAEDIVTFAFYDASSGSRNAIMVYADGHVVMQSA